MVVLGIIAALAVGTFQTVRSASAENIALQSAEQVVRNAENVSAFQGEELSGAIGNSNIDIAGSEINETSGAQYYSSIGESYAGKVIVYENGECAEAIIENDGSINVTSCSWDPMQASGGDNVYDIDVNGVTYRVHEFTTVGESTFTVTDLGSTGSVEYLIVGGGGGRPLHTGGLGTEGQDNDGGDSQASNTSSSSAGGAGGLNSPDNGGSGEPNTGGGGAVGGYNGGAFTGANGGAGAGGIVIIRYPLTTR